MPRILKLSPNVPVEIALGSPDGVNVVSPHGTPAVKYTLVDGRTFYATEPVDAKFKQMGIRPNEPISICRRIVEGQTITEVTRLADSSKLEPKAETPPELDTDSGLPADDSASDDPGPHSESELNPPEPVNGKQSSARPVTQLEQALKTAIFASHMAEEYGKEIGYVVRFDQESVKSMALTVLIGMQGGRN